MTRPLFLAAALLFAAGCTHAQQIDDHANRELLANHFEAESEVIKLHCEGGRDLGPGCGLLLTHAATLEFREKFRAKKCADKTTEQCQELYQREVEVALGDRYWAADWNGIAKRCNEEAPRCEDALQYERDLLGSHNTRVLIEASNKEMAIEATRDAAHRADRARAANAGYEFIALFDRPVCRSYPNILGGWTTVCTR